MNVPFYVNTCWTLLLASLFISSFRPWDERRSCTNKKSFDEDQRSFFSLKINHLKSRPSILLHSLSINCNVQMFNYDSTSIEYFFVFLIFLIVLKGYYKHVCGGFLKLGTPRNNIHCFSIGTLSFVWNCFLYINVIISNVNLIWLWSKMFGTGPIFTGRS